VSQDYFVDGRLQITFFHSALAKTQMVQINNDGKYISIELKLFLHLLKEEELLNLVYRKYCGGQ